MTKAQKIGRITTALTMIVEAVEDLQLAEEPELAKAVRDVQKQVKDKLVELRRPDAQAGS